ncbi:IS4/Tn5 family transposase DNA-binding protein [Azospirillum doebereinerae]
MTIGLLILNDVREVPMVTGTNAWIEDELAGCRLADERLERRLSTLLDQMAGAMGDSIPLACQDWANTKAAYRFFSNDRVSEGDVSMR